MDELGYALSVLDHRSGLDPQDGLAGFACGIAHLQCFQMSLVQRPGV